MKITITVTADLDKDSESLKELFKLLEKLPPPKVKQKAKAPTAKPKTKP